MLTAFGTSSLFLVSYLIYPEPQNALDVSPGMKVPDFPEGKRPKATDVSPWYGVYHYWLGALCHYGVTIKDNLTFIPVRRNDYDEYDKEFCTAI